MKKSSAAIRSWVVTSAVCAALTIAPAALAVDEYEDAGGDNTAATTNGLEAVEQEHDLEAVGGVADEDWYGIIVDHRRSYEAQVYALGGQPNFSVPGALSLRSADGLTVIAASQGLRAGAVVRWINDTDNDLIQKLRVSTGQTALTARARYLIRLRETTLYCPRYNNTGTQVSVLIVQQTRQRPATCDVNAYFYDQNTGQLVGSSSNVLTPDNMLAFPVGTVPGVNGTRGHVRIANTCGVAGLRGKLVALEPSTGFSFDTPCDVRDSR